VGGRVEPRTRAERNIAWCERHLRLPEGRFVGQPLVMAEFMREDFRAIYDNPAGTRRAVISRGRKNAKTTESAMLLLLHLAGPEARPNSQMFSAAQSREQAAVLFELAAKMVRMSETLSQFVGIRDTAKQLYCQELGTLYRALSAEASTAFGLSPVLTIHDELGQVRGPRSPLYEALETATAAQEAPLSIIISTQAPTDEDLLSVLIDDARGGHDPRTVLRLATADEDADPFHADTIRQANPAFDVFMNREEVLSMAEDARRMPSREAEFRNLVLNQRIESHSPYVARAVWNANAGQPAAEIGDAPVYVGVDLSAVSDLTALVEVVPLGDEWHVYPTFWLPESGLVERSRKDRVPYDVWAKKGHLTLTPGATVDYDYVADHMAELHRRRNVQAVAFDRWNMRFLRPYLEKTLPEDELAKWSGFGQGFQSMSPALRSLDGLMLKESLRHGGHPVLAMCAANSVVKADPAGNRKLVKVGPNKRIDGMIALAMAVAIAETHEPVERRASVYEERGVMVL